MVHGRAVVVALDRESLTRRRSSTQSHPCTPTHSHCTQFRQLLLFFSSPNRFSLRVQRTGCSRTVPLTSPPSVRVQWVIQLCRPLAHGNSTCIKRPAGFNGKILSLLTDHAIFWAQFSRFRPAFVDFPIHRPNRNADFTISSSRSALHPHLFTHKIVGKISPFVRRESESIVCFRAQCGLLPFCNRYLSVTGFLSLFRYQKEEKRADSRQTFIS